MNIKSPKTIAVDLTPLLPGGDNGGVKVFVLALLPALAKIAPQTQFVLLTQAGSHEELRSLERDNVRCMMVRKQSNHQKETLEKQSLLMKMFAYCPAPLRRKMVSSGCFLRSKLKQYRARGLLKRIEADLLFCPFTAPTYFEPEIPTVCTIHDLQYKTYAQFFSLEDVVYRDWVFKEACKRATYIAAISDYSNRSAVSHGNLSPDRIKTIYLRLAKRFAATPDPGTSLLNKLTLYPDRYLIYPANFWKHKNHEMLLTAFNLACRSGLPSDIQLVCNGAPGARRDGLMQAAQHMGLKERVVFPGYLSDEDLGLLMAKSAGMIFPSLYEGFGLPIIEAMVAGIPVACSNRTALPEIAGKAAHLFDPRIPDEMANAMIRIIEDNALRASLVEAGQQRASVFSESSLMASEYWALFQQAVS